MHILCPCLTWLWGRTCGLAHRLSRIPHYNMTLNSLWSESTKIKCTNRSDLLLSTTLLGLLQWHFSYRALAISPVCHKTTGRITLLVLNSYQDKYSFEIIRTVESQQLHFNVSFCHPTFFKQTKCRNTRSNPLLLNITFKNNYNGNCFLEIINSYEHAQ